MSEPNDALLDSINFRIDPLKKQKLQKIADKNFRSVTGQMNFLIDQCILEAENAAKT